MKIKVGVRMICPNHGPVRLQEGAQSDDGDDDDDTSRELTNGEAEGVASAAPAASRRTGRTRGARALRLQARREKWVSFHWPFW